MITTTLPRASLAGIGCSAEYFDLVYFYCGRPPPLPPDICMIILEIAGLCGKGRTCSYFWVYN